MSNHKKWNLAMRLELYESLVRQYGPLAGWHRIDLPKKGGKEEYLSFLRKFSLHWNEKHGIHLGKQGTDGVEAIRQQIAYATTQQEVVTDPKTWMANKVAALEVGFIDSIPNMIIENR